MNNITPKRHKYTTSKDNEKYMAMLYQLEDETGVSPFPVAMWDMITIIGGFKRDKGCFMSLRSMSLEMGKISTRTLQNYTDYLIAQGVITSTVIYENGKTKCVRRLGTPKGRVIESVKAYRKRTGKYKYDTKGQHKMSDDQHEIFSQPLRKNFMYPYEKFSPYIESINKRTIIRNTTYNPPFGKRNPPPQDKGNSRRPADAGGAGKSRPHCERLRAREVGQEFSKEAEKTNIKPVEVDEMPKRKNPKNQRERRAEAVRQHNLGHIVNPLGKTDNRPRRLCWKRARDIGATGAVTVSQLYRHLVTKYLEVHGESIEAQLPDDRTAIASWFDDLAQRFLETCGYHPTYRELSEYFDWILEPKRAAKLAKVGDATNQAAHVRAQQLKGGMYIRQFYDQVLSKRSRSRRQEILSPGAQRIQAGNNEYDEACDRCEKSFGNKAAEIFSLIRYGIPIMVQYLHDQKGMSESQCSQRIIDLLADHINQATDKEKAMRELGVIMKTSESRQYIYNDAFLWWANWKEKCQEINAAIASRTKSAQ